MPVGSETSGTVCHIVMDDGRDNRLSRDMCDALTRKLTEAFQDETVTIVLLTGKGSHFSAGYDLGGLSSEANQIALFQLVDLLSDAPKPVIAGLQGDAFGAGLEISLLCAFRLAASGVSVGFPDVLHGLPTGAGATQTLPRILGASRSLLIILSGETVSASELGTAIDAEFEGDFLSGAMRFAETLAEQNLGPISIADRLEGFADPSAYQRALVAAREASSAKVNEDIIGAVESALLLPFSSGMAMEREVFRNAEARPKARARRHLVHQRWLLAQQANGSDIAKVAVIGDGELSQVCAARLLLAGAAVSHVHGSTVQSEDLRFDILDIARQEFEDSQTGTFHEAQLSEQLNVSADLSDCTTADLVLDASEEDLSALRTRAKTLGELLPGHVVLAIASQYLGFGPIESAFARPTQVAKLWLEAGLVQEFCTFSIPSGKHAASRSMVHSLLKMLGLAGIETKTEAGQTVISLWLQLIQAAETLCIEGTPISAIDAALEEIGFSDGPFRMVDALGLDIVEQLSADVPGFEGKLSIARTLAENGQTGVDSGAGYYLYENDHAGLPNPEATRVIQSLREERGQKVADLEIQQYCLAVLANEAAKLLAHQAIKSPGELDLLLTDAFGLSPDLGGPLHAADNAGLLHLRYLLTEENGRDRPRQALLDMIKNGLNFSALNDEAQSFS